jgi:hypothetical protein
MSGKWTELWDDERQRWIKVYIDLPTPIRAGSASTAPGGDPDPILYGPDGNRIRKPAGPPSIGFRKP